MKLFLIRHGESEANLHRYYAGQADMALTERGEQQAAALQPILTAYLFDKVYSSDLQRATATCENALPGIPFEKLALLREYDIGSLTGRPLGSLKHFIDKDPAHYPDYREFGGENVQMVCQRAKTFLESLEDQPYEFVAAFTHYGFINSILRTVLGVAFDTDRIRTDNCAVHVMEFDGSKWRVLALNYGAKV